MSILDRAIVKAFQRRRDSEALAKRVAVTPCAASPIPAAPAPRGDTSSSTLEKALAPHKQTSIAESTTSESVSMENSDEAVAQYAAPMAGHDDISSPSPTFADDAHLHAERIGRSSTALAELPSYSTAHTASAPSPSHFNEHELRSAEHVSDEPVWDSRAHRSETDLLVADVPPPLPAPVERPVAHPWKWPEICEQLDQFTGDGFRQLAKHLQFAALQGHKVLAFVSSTPGVGRTSVLLTLTRILALEGNTTALLIDADCKHPQLASIIGNDLGGGLRDVVHGQQQLEQAVLPMTPGRVSVLPLNDSVSDTEWQGFVAPLRVLLKHAREDYDMILIDAGVLGPETRLADCWLRGAVDAVITISRQLTANRTEHEVLDWKQIGIESLGVIETFA